MIEINKVLQIEKVSIWRKIEAMVLCTQENI
jgi:hypothetical protein